MKTPAYLMLPKEKTRLLIPIAVAMGASLGSLTWMMTHRAPLIPLIVALSVALTLSVLAARILRKKDPPQAAKVELST